MFQELYLYQRDFEFLKDVKPTLQKDMEKQTEPERHFHWSLKYWLPRNYEVP